jgi:hypothetical protein
MAGYNLRSSAGVAQLIERHLAKVQVDGSILTLASIDTRGRAWRIW